MKDSTVDIFDGEFPLAWFAAVSTVAFTVLASIATDRENAQRALLVGATSAVFLAIGALNTFEATSEDRPKQGKLIDDIFAFHLSILPLFALMKTKGFSTYAIAMASFGAAAMTLTRGLEKHVTGAQGVHAASRATLVGLVALAHTFVPDDAGMRVKTGALAAEFVYFWAFRMLAPAKDGSVAGLEGAQDVVEAATGSRVDLSASDDDASEGEKCAPMCVDDDGTAASCFKHNAEVQRVHAQAAENRATHLPEFYGMTAKERRCLRSHGVGERCAFCQGGHGCMRTAPDGETCDSSSNDANARLDRMRTESERLQDSEHGVLSLEEQVQLMRTSAY